MYHVNVNTTRRTRGQQQTSTLEAVQHGTHMLTELGGSNYSEQSYFLTIAHGLLCLSVEKNPSPCFFSPNCWGCGGGCWTSLGIPKAYIVVTDSIAPTSLRLRSTPSLTQSESLLATLHAKPCIVVGISFW